MKPATAQTNSGWIMKDLQKDPSSRLLLEEPDGNGPKRLCIVGDLVKQCLNIFEEGPKAVHRAL